MKLLNDNHLVVNNHEMMGAPEYAAPETTVFSFQPEGVLCASAYHEGFEEIEDDYII